MDIQKQAGYWLNSAEQNLSAAEDMLKNAHFDWCLFIGHLALEKVLKAGCVKYTGEIPPKTHNLVYLAEKTGLTIEKEMQRFLFEVNTFNIETRYADYKSEFYQKCSKEFTEEKFNQIKEVYFWIKQQI